MFSFYASSADVYHSTEPSLLSQSAVMEDIGTKLESLGLGHYKTCLINNGFEDWKTVLDITEEDLVELGFKLGHRRVLQREISQYQSQNSPSDAVVRSPASRNTPPTPTRKVNTEKRTKRRYRWHPRPDPNAPKRPKTAYVNFSDRLRAQPEIGVMSFVDIAREVGRQWQDMSPTVKAAWEDQAAQVWRMLKPRNTFVNNSKGNTRVRGPDGTLPPHCQIPRVSRLS
jgi:hypothetical protein